MQTRGIPSRNRRETSDEIVDNDNFKVSEQSNGQRSDRRNLRKRRDTTVVEQALSLNVSVNDTQRSRREVAGCVVDYNAQRKLLVGCTEPNVIEVRPHCIEDSDEGNKISFNHLSVPYVLTGLMFQCIIVTDRGQKIRLFL